MAASGPDRYLKMRSGRWSYQRRVPAKIMLLDNRAPLIQEALNTSNLNEARHKRDVCEDRDNRIWRAIQGFDGNGLKANAAREILKALGLDAMPQYPGGEPEDGMIAKLYEQRLAAIEEKYKATTRAILNKRRDLSAQAFESFPATDFEDSNDRLVAIRDWMASQEDEWPQRSDFADGVFDDLPAEVADHYRETQERKAAVHEYMPPILSQTVEAVDAVTGRIPGLMLGKAQGKSVMLSNAMPDWEKMNRKRLDGKDDGAKKRTKQTVERAINRFCRVIGDVDVLDIDRDLAVEFFDYHDALINPPEGSDDRPVKPASAKRDFQELRGVWKAVARRHGVDLRECPFDGLTFSETESERKPYSVEWIVDRWLKPGVFGGLNNEALSILYVLLETGARMSEVCSLRPEDIHLTSNIPHISIQTYDDGKNKRKLKTKSSQRDVPLTGLALEAMRRHPNGFPRYIGNAGGFSALMSKFLRTNGLNEDGRTLHSLRHTYIDRLRNAGVREDLRKAIVGHSAHDEHGRYGDGFGLEMRHEAMNDIALPYDPAILNE